MLLTIAPASPILPLVSLIRATFYSTTVFLVAGGATVFFLRRKTSSQNFYIGLRTAVTAIWLAPLAVALEQRSLFAVVPWVVFCVEAARLIGSLKGVSADEPVGPSSESIFQSPAANWKPTLLSAAGAFLLQSAIVVAIGQKMIAGACLAIFGAVMWVWRGVWMVQSSPPSKPSYFPRKIFNLFSASTTLILLVWSPYFVPHGNFRSLAALWHFFTSSPSRAMRASNTKPDANGTPDSGGSPLAIGPVFPGVILYPQLKPRETIIAPPPQSSEGAGTAHSEPLSIPFNGVYWYWSFPEEELPSTAVRKHGNPDQMAFRSTDGASLWMEARQNLATAIALKCCRAIQVVIENADKQPKAVGIELLLRNKAVMGKPYLSLGTQSASPYVAHSDIPTRQTLTYHIPGEMKLGKFDEVKVVFRLDWRRRDKSAKIAISRFVLVPTSQEN